MKEHVHLILEPVMSSSRCMRCLSPALLSLRLTVTGARKGFLESKGLKINKRQTVQCRNVITKET